MDGETKSENKKYYWAAVSVVENNSLAGRPKVGMGHAVMDKHPLLWILDNATETRTIQLQNWIEIPEDVYLIYLEKGKQDANKPTILKPVK